MHFSIKISNIRGINILSSLTDLQDFPNNNIRMIGILFMKLKELVYKLQCHFSRSITALPVNIPSKINIFRNFKVSMLTLVSYQILQMDRFFLLVFLLLLFCLFVCLVLFINKNSDRLEIFK